MMKGTSSVKKFRKKPVEIEAVQWKGTNYHEVISFIGAETPVPNADQIIQIQTLEGVMTAQKGDWIIKGVHGEFYPCKPAIFEKTYDSVN
jgi:hypothetical protein